MMSKIYNKLVRDRIPEIIIAAGKEPVTRTAGDDEYEQLLKAKLAEEVDEFLTGDNPEELADILEVLQAIAKAKGITWEQVVANADSKRAERGGFEEKIVLVEVKE
jgi:predicted house-cleaning noncanonical NTP pyrophosphatase (MazG superfamily)